MLCSEGFGAVVVVAAVEVSVVVAMVVVAVVEVASTLVAGGSELVEDQMFADAETEGHCWVQERFEDDC